MDLVTNFLTSWRERGGSAWREWKIICFDPPHLLTDADKDFISSHSRELLAALPEQTALVVTSEPEASHSEAEPQRARTPLRHPPDRAQPPLPPDPIIVPSEPPAVSSKAAPPPPSKAAPRPVLSVRGYGEVTERDVLEALRDHGDEMVADYRAGRISKGQAYEMARQRVEAFLRIGSVRVGGVWIPRAFLGGGR